MNLEIIHQVDERQNYNVSPSSPQNTKKESLCKKLCSFISFVNFNKVEAQKPYLVEIDSPKYSNLYLRKTLVLDLDETLVHSSFKDTGNWDFTVDIVVQGMDFKIFVSVRPGTYQFIDCLSSYYDVVLFTASLKEYADPVMDILDPQRKAVSRMFREHCVLIDNQLVKDLNCLEKDLCSVIIIDNSEISFKLQPENAFHIKDFFYDKTDNELEKLTAFLIWMIQVTDVRPVSRYVKTHQQIPLTIPSSITNSLKELESQFIQYEEQQNQSNDGRKNNNRQNSGAILLNQHESSSRQELIANKEHTSNRVAKKIPSYKVSKTMNIVIDSPLYLDDDKGIRNKININSPVNTEGQSNKFHLECDEGFSNSKKMTLETQSKEQESLENEV